MLHLLHSHNMSHAGRIGEPFDPLQHHRPLSQIQQYTLPLPPILTTTPSSSTPSSAAAAAATSAITPTYSASDSLWSGRDPLTPPVDITRPSTTTTVTTADIAGVRQPSSRLPLMNSNGIATSQAAAATSSLSRPVLQSNLHGGSFIGNDAYRLSAGRSPRRSSVSTQHHRRSSGEAVAPVLQVPKSIQSPVMDLSQLVAEVRAESALVDQDSGTNLNIADYMLVLV